MADAEALIRELMELKPDLTREEIDELIKAKKERIGEGYLTDEGAVFLIGSDQGVTLAGKQSSEVDIKGLYAGAKEVTLEARVMAISPTKKLTRKDGTPLLLRTMTVFDAERSVSVKLWNEKAESEAVNALEPGDPVRIVKAYVKSDFDGSAMLNVGSSSEIEAPEGESGIPTLESKMVDVSEVKGEEKNIAVYGSADGQITSMSYTGSRGDQRTALRMRLRGKDNRSTRVVLWGRGEEDIPKMVPRSRKVTLLAVRSKQANQGLEIHGNDASQMIVEGSQEPEPVTVRIISASKPEDKRFVLAVGEDKQIYSMVDLSGMTDQYEEGAAVEIIPTRNHGGSLTIDSKSMVRSIGGESIPNVDDLLKKVDDLEIGTRGCLDVIVLKPPTRRDIQTKAGQTVPLSEALVEDYTGQIWVKGWRSQADMVDTCKQGVLVRITGADIRPGMEGRKEVVLNAFSKIAPKPGS
ncbi:MAG: single-stranded DNA-binding protein [Nitrosopumilus sp.]|nr:single-stranded DNA-binding protein [Nitrosopumilus sp.]